MDAKKEAKIEIRIGQLIHSVTLVSSGDNRIRLKDEEVEKLAGLKGTSDREIESLWEEIGSKIIELCELGHQAKNLGLTMDNIKEGRFTIKPNTP